MSFYEFKEGDAWEFARMQGIGTRQKGNELHFIKCPYCKSTKDKWTFAIDIKTGQFKCLRASCGVKGNFITLSRDFNFSLGDEVDEYYRTKKSFKKLPTPKEPIKPKEPAIEYLLKRGISEKVAARYEITTQTEHKNILVFPFYDEKGEMQFVKYRKMDFDKEQDNNKEWCESNCKPILFGMKQCNLENKRLILTEGQIDSLSVAEAEIENAVSVPNGAKGFTWIPYCYDWLQQFTELIVFGDYERGEISLLNEMKNRFTGIVKVVRKQDYKGCKDANEILVKYGKESVKNAVENAEIIPVRAVKDLADVKSVDLYRLPKISTGIDSIDKILSGGMFYGQLIVLTGKRGDGKSTLASQIVANALDAGKKIFAYSGELRDYFFKRWLNLQMAGKHNVITRTEIDSTVNYYITNSIDEIISESYRGRAFLFDDTSVDDGEITELLDIIERSVKQYGIDLVLVDNLMTCLDVSLNTDLYRAQSKFMDKLVKISKLLNVVIILVAHPRKNRYGTDDTDEISGSADITNKADIVFTYKRSKELGDSVRKLSISKNRLTGKLAVGEKEISLFFDEASKRISDRESDFTKVFTWEEAQLKFGWIEENEWTKDNPFV